MTASPSLPDPRAPSSSAAAQALFRPQALAARYSVIDVPLRLRAPAMHVAAMALLLSVVLGAIGLARQPYAEKLTVSGFAQRASGRIAVRAPQAGTVSELLVAEGDWVEPGTVLLRLSADSMLNDGRSGTVARQQALLAERSALLESTRLAEQRHARALRRIDAALTHGVALRLAA